ncbi:MAG: AAA family ATPase [Burkholderiales bacterium]
MLRNAQCVMKNPFAYGGVVSGHAFCNRATEKADLLRAIRNNEKLFVFSERRFGKTSLVQSVIAKLPKKDTVSAYVDLWPTDDEPSFVTALAKAITSSMTTSAERLLTTGKALFSSLVPTMTLNDEGKPELSFGFGKNVKVDRALEEVLETPSRIANRQNKNVVIVFDEFQQILEYQNDLVERKLRSVIQNHPKVAYIFLGSRRHLIQKMFMDKTRPLYRAGGHYPLGAISEAHWTPFIRNHFRATDRFVSDELIHSICTCTQGHPFYTQHLCHAVWELCDRKARVTPKMVNAATQLLLERENYAYTTLWESLALNQRKLLKGLASEASKVQFSSEFISAYGLGSASSVQRAADSLLERDVIDRDNGSFLITDRFLGSGYKTFKFANNVTHCALRMLRSDSVMLN